MLFYLQPTSLSGHTATLTEEGMVVVLGGIDQSLSPRVGVMTYDPQLDSWEAWFADTLPLLSKK